MLPALWIAAFEVPRRAVSEMFAQDRWAVSEFWRPNGGKSDYGWIAARAMTSALADQEAHLVIDVDAVRRSAAARRIGPPRAKVSDLVRLGNTLSARVIVRGELVECGVERVEGGSRAWATLRTVAYDVPSARPCNGALEYAESEIHPYGTANATLVTEAIRLAASRLVRRMQITVMPQATVLNHEEQTPLINRGTKDGFRKGDEVVVTRGGLTLGHAVVGQTEGDQAQIVPRDVVGQVSPGDRVWAVFDAPLPSPHLRRGSSRLLDRDGRATPKGRH